MMTTTAEHMEAHIQGLHAQVWALQNQLALSHKINTVLLHRLGGDLVVCTEELIAINREFPFVDIKVERDFTQIKLYTTPPDVPNTLLEPGQVPR